MSKRDLRLCRGADVDTTRYFECRALLHGRHRLIVDARAISKPIFAVTDRLFRSISGPRVLIYHQVAAGHGKQMDVTFEDFEWHLEWLSENREIVDLESALRRWDSPDSDLLVVLTFDDGFLDTYTTVFPILKAYGFPFTVYVTTSYVSEEHDFEEGLTWIQLNEMAESGLVTIAAHTHTHADLRSLDPSEVAEEIDKSHSLLESRLGVRVRHFAYPWGYWSETADLLIRTEYSSAALGAPHIGTASRDFDAHLMHRFPVQLSDGRRWFEARLTGGLLLEEEVRRRLRHYRGP